MTERLNLDIQFASQIDLLDKRVKRLETLEFSSVTGGSLSLLEDVKLTAPQATISFLNIPQTAKHLKLIIAARDTAAVTQKRLQMIFNNDAVAANYDFYNAFHRFAVLLNDRQNIGVEALIDLGNVPGGNSLAGAFGACEVTIPDYTDPNKMTAITFHSFTVLTMVSGELLEWAGGGYYEPTTAITRIDITLGAGTNFATNSRFTLYGMA